MRSADLRSREQTSCLMISAVVSLNVTAGESSQRRTSTPDMNHNNNDKNNNVFVSDRRSCFWTEDGKRVSVF